MSNNLNKNLSSSKRRLLILSDYGLDDACASVYLLENAALFDGIDILAIGGNTSAQNSLDNAKKLLEQYAKEKGVKKLDGIRLIDTCEVKQPFHNLPSIHGNDGMGDLFKKAESLPVELFKFDEYIDKMLLQEKPFAENTVIFSVGPCTVTKILLEQLGKCPLVIMAGVINEPPNFNDYEFNQGLDVPAYNFTVKYPHVIATLDSCHKEYFNSAKERLPDESLLNKLINRSVLFNEEILPGKCYIYDYIAARYLVEPQIFDVVEQRDKWGNKLFNLEVK